MKYLLGSTVELVAIAVCTLSLGLRLGRVPLFSAGRIVLAVALGAACLPALTVLVVRCISKISGSSERGQ